MRSKPYYLSNIREHDKNNLITLLSGEFNFDDLHQIR